MDTSDLRIRMSDCPEIQGKRDALREGDVWAVYLTYAERRVREPKHQVRINTYQQEWGSYTVTDETKDIWLPRQEQLQMIVECDNWEIRAYPVNTLKGHHCFEMGLYVEGVVNVEADTLEQLWLLDYMAKKHDKSWDGEKWI